MSMNPSRRGSIRTAAARQTPPRLSKRRLEGMVEEATIDAYGEAEQAGGFFTMIEEDLRIPFSTTVFGVAVTVTKVEMTIADEIVVVCRHGKEKQRIPILELPLPSPPPVGAEWIEAYRHWQRGGQ
jgi:hypothetical protein